MCWKMTSLSSTLKSFRYYDLLQSITLFTRMKKQHLKCQQGPLNEISLRDSEACIVHEE